MFTAFGDTSPETNLTLLYKGSALGVVELPEVHVEGGTRTPFTMGSRVTIRDVDVFGQFAVDLINSKTVTWGFEGDPDVTCDLLGIPLHFSAVHVRKDVDMAGCDGLKNVTIDVFDFTRSTKTQVVADMVVSVVNPSPVFAELGQLGFDIVFE